MGPYTIKINPKLNKEQFGHLWGLYNGENIQLYTSGRQNGWTKGQREPDFPFSPNGITRWSAHPHSYKGSINLEAVGRTRRLASCDPTEGLPNATNPGSQRKPSGSKLMERILREEARATQSSMEKFTKI